MERSQIPQAKAAKADEDLRKWAVEQTCALARSGVTSVNGKMDVVAIARSFEDYVRGRITT